MKKRLVFLRCGGAGLAISDTGPPEKPIVIKGGLYMRVLLKKMSLSAKLFVPVSTSGILMLVVGVIVYLPSMGVSMNQNVASALAAAIIVISIGFSILAWYAVSSEIRKPMQKAIEAVEGVSGGDLTRRIETDLTDEMGTLYRHMNNFVEKLHDAVTRVDESSVSVLYAANILDTTAEHMSTGIQQVVSQIT